MTANKAEKLEPRGRTLRKRTPGFLPGTRRINSACYVCWPSLPNRYHRAACCELSPQEGETEDSAMIPSKALLSTGGSIASQAVRVRRRIRGTCFLAGMCLLSTWTSATAFAEDLILEDEIEGLFEPNQTVNVCSVEAGLIKSLNLRVGDVVRSQAPIAQLDDEIHQVETQLATARANSKGEMEVALADLELRRARLAQLTALRLTGDATEEEFARAETELQLAQARVTAQEEQLHLHSLDAQKADINLQRRIIRAPFSGAVAAILARPGEYVSPVHPEIVTLVQVDPILAVFDLPRELLAGCERDKPVVVRLHDGRTVQGVVDSISILIDAASRTAELRVRIPNPHHELRSGDRCLLVIDKTDNSSGRRRGVRSDNGQ
jgi:RND family efflux transporter MFP subunit